jgi:putative membrane protein
MGTGTGSSSTTIGNMSREEFDRMNAQGAAAVAAITPTNTALSKGDQKLMMEVAMGGMMQLEMSRVGVQRATNEEARVLAQSEVEEQTALAAKLREIATAKNVTLPEAPDAKARGAATKLQSASADNFDRNYVRESGVKGHEKLDKVMTRVGTRATDENLKALATAAHPLVRTHLQVSRDVLNKMAGTRNNSGGGNTNSGSGGNTNSGSGGNTNANSNSGSNANSNR